LKATLIILISIFIFLVFCFRLTSAQNDRVEDYHTDSLAFRKLENAVPDSSRIWYGYYKYPNPFSPSINLKSFYIEVPSDCNLKISLYHNNIFLRELINRSVKSGVYQLAPLYFDYFHFYESGTYILEVNYESKIINQEFTFERDNFNRSFLADTLRLRFRNIPKPDYFKLSNAYPNPFSGVHSVYMDLPVKSKVRAKLYNYKFHEVFELFDTEFDAGAYSFLPYFGKYMLNLSSGIYYLEMKTEEYTSQIKILIVK